MKTRQTTTEEKEVFKYLNRLRESGATNMWGATPYICKKFPGISKEQASRKLLLWMDSFNNEGNYNTIKI